jgi:predicted  nucleic acid-binding Zn-ribbon protein
MDSLDVRRVMFHRPKREHLAHELHKAQRRVRHLESELSEARKSRDVVVGQRNKVMEALRRAKDSAAGDATGERGQDG